MGKPSDKQDSTQPLSSSQIVTVTPNTPAIDRNDRSVWRQVVVGADDFAVKPVKRKWTVLWVVIMIALAGGIAAAVYVVVRSPSAVAIVDAAVAPMSTPPADAAVAVDAAPDAPIDAPVDAAAPEDAAVPADAALPADAGVPMKKPPPKKPPKKLPPKPTKRHAG
jgi:hypothetical protein